jgi:hypothetical protein
MEFYRRANTCIHLGAPLYKLNALSVRGAETAEGTEQSLPIKERLARLKSEIPNDDLSGFTDFEHDMLGELDALERSYRNKEQI